MLQFMNDKSQSVIKEKLNITEAVTAKRQLDELARRSEVDASAGIYLKQLEDVEAIEYGGQQFYFYIARVMPGKFVNAHLHKNGVEPYYFLSGDNGQLNICLR